MGVLYTEVLPPVEDLPPTPKSSPAQPGRVLPPVEIDGTPVRFVTTGVVTRSGVPVLEVLGGRGGEA